MARPDSSRKKIDVSRPAEPLGFNPFAGLGEVDALKDLAPGPAEPEPQKAETKTRPEKPVPLAVPAGSRGRLVLRKETKDRGGKVVVVIYGFDVLPGANAVMIAELAKELKGKLGCGGSFDRREIVLQGDRCAEVCGALEKMGFRVDGVKS